MIMAAADLLARERGSRPTTRSATRIEGNFCRCTGYQNIVAAIRAGGRDAMRDGAARPRPPARTE